MAVWAAKICKKQQQQQRNRLNFWRNTAQCHAAVTNNITRPSDRLVWSDGLVLLCRLVSQTIRQRECTSKGGEILCKLVADGKSHLGRTVASNSMARNQVLSRRSSQTKWWYSVAPPQRHNPLSCFNIKISELRTIINERIISKYSICYCVCQISVTCYSWTALATSLHLYILILWQPLHRLCRSNPLWPQLLHYPKQSHLFESLRRVFKGKESLQGRVMRRKGGNPKSICILPLLVVQLQFPHSK